MSTNSTFTTIPDGYLPKYTGNNDKLTCLQNCKGILDTKNIDGQDYIKYQCPSAYCDTTNTCNCGDECNKINGTCVMKDKDNCTLDCQNYDSKTGKFACPNATCSNKSCDCGNECIYAREDGVIQTCFPFKIKDSNNNIFYLENIQQLKSSFKADPKTTLLFNNGKSLDMKIDTECKNFDFNNKNYCVDPDDLDILLTHKNNINTKKSSVIQATKRDIQKYYEDNILNPIKQLETITNNKNSNDKNCNTQYKFIFNSKTYCIKDENVLAKLLVEKQKIINNIQNINTYAKSKFSENSSSYKSDETQIYKILDKYDNFLKKGS